MAIRVKRRGDNPVSRDGPAVGMMKISIDNPRPALFLYNFSEEANQSIRMEIECKQVALAPNIFSNALHLLLVA